MTPPLRPAGRAGRAATGDGRQRRADAIIQKSGDDYLVRMKLLTVMSEKLC
jgi:hypothetical protein